VKELARPSIGRGRPGTRGPANATVRQGYAARQARASQGGNHLWKTAFLQVKGEFNPHLAAVENGATFALYHCDVDL
jgi:hypothetical protein